MLELAKVLRHALLGSIPTFSTNLADKEYIVAKSSGLQVAGNPRQYGLRLRYGF